MASKQWPHFAQWRPRAEQVKAGAGNAGHSVLPPSADALQGESTSYLSPYHGLPKRGPPRLCLMGGFKVTWWCSSCKGSWEREVLASTLGRLGILSRTFLKFLQRSGAPCMLSISTLVPVQSLTLSYRSSLPHSFSWVLLSLFPGHLWSIFPPQSFSRFLQLLPPLCLAMPGQTFAPASTEAIVRIYFHVCLPPGLSFWGSGRILFHL